MEWVKLRKFNEKKFKSIIRAYPFDAILSIQESCSRQEEAYYKSVEECQRKKAFALSLALSPAQLKDAEEGRALGWRRYNLFKSMRLACEEELERRFVVEGEDEQHGATAQQ